MIGWWCLAAAAWGETLEDWFPAAELTAAAVAQALPPEIRGEPARVYDHSTRTADLADPAARDLERAALGDRADALEPADGVRCYARLALRLMRVGALEHVHQWALAEHCGLAQPPNVVGKFVGSDRLAELVRQLVAQADDPDLRSLAVAVLPEGELTVGVLVGTYGTVAFEPFPRVVEAGAVMRIPGTVLDAGAEYALYVSTDGAEVREYPMTGSGAFDLEFPLPAAPGAYRVAMNRFEGDTFPDSPFFFTVYAGVEPEPVPVPDFGTAPAGAAPAQVEAEILEDINAARGEYGLAPLQAAGSPQTLRAVLEGMPQGERAAWRYLRKALRQDPLPGELHGSWHPAISTNSRTSAAASWVLLEHTAFRSATLDPTADKLVLGAIRDEHGLQVALEVVQPAPDAASAGQAMRDELAARWPEGAPGAAPRLEARLTALAAEAASGDLPERKLSSAVGKVVKKAGLVRGQAAWMTFVVPAGQPVDSAAVQVQPWARDLAVGQATGDLGERGGVAYTVAIALVAADAD